MPVQCILVYFVFQISKFSFEIILIRWYRKLHYYRSNSNNDHNNYENNSIKNRNYSNDNDDNNNNNNDIYNDNGNYDKSEFKYS